MILTFLKNCAPNICTPVMQSCLYNLANWIASSLLKRNRSTRFWCSGAFIVNFEQIFCIVLVLFIVDFNESMLAGNNI